MGKTRRRTPESTKPDRLYAKRMRKTHKTHRERKRRAKRVGPENQNQCGRKIRYRSECDALRAARNRAPHSRRLEAYRCPICNGWHLTSHGQRRRVEGRDSEASDGEGLAALQDARAEHRRQGERRA